MESSARSSPSGLAELGQRARVASRRMALASSEEKGAGLVASAQLLRERADEVLAANASDLEAVRAAGASPAVTDRLRLDPARVDAMAAGLVKVAALEDPVGETVRGWVRPNGLEIRQVRVPLGVIGVIYENRPNVTSDAAGLCLKSGNAALLRGSSTAIASNRAIAQLLRQGCAKAGLPEDSVLMVDATQRESVSEFVRLRGIIDCLIPRGGPSLINAVLDNATVPYVLDGAGNCHVYVDSHADLDMARSIVLNGKTQRPSVCNATESLVVHRSVAASFLPVLAADLAGVRLLGDETVRGILGEDQVEPATEEDYSAEFLGLELSIKVVDDLDAAIDHIRRHGSGHTEAIVTADLSAASRFQREVDAAAIMVNASTRFTDGEQFGFGAEIGISTQKLHARGPMGLRELTTTKYLVTGSGQVRR